MSSNKQTISNRLAHFIDTFWSDKQSHLINETEPFKNCAEVKYVEFPEAIIRYKIVGKGNQTIVLAADPPVVIEQYDELIKQLENDFRVIIFELPGFGFSLPRSKMSFDFTSVNNLIAKFLKKLDLSPYILAFSCGATYGAIDIANRFPEMVKAVAMIQAPSWAEEVKWKHGRDTKGILAKPVFGQIALQFLKRKRAPQWLDAAVGRREMLTEFVETTDNAFAQGACFCLASSFQRYLTDESPDLSPIKQPSIIFWGEADKSHKRTDKTSSNIYCPQAENIIFENAGHFPELEEPREFAAKMKEWVSSLSS